LIGSPSSLICRPC